jgi:DNA-binding response OmpR family regulator
MRQTILIADDEAKIADLVRAYLEAEGFRAIVARDGDEALAACASEKVSCAVLDIGMPGPDGFEVAKAIRRSCDMPIVFLTARAEESEKLSGFELGADDYVVKPFSPRELVARIKAVLRRSLPRGDGRKLEAGALSMDAERREARVDGELKELTAAQFDILFALARQPGRVFTRLELLEAATQAAFEGYERTIDAHIKNLRKAIGDDPKNPRIVGTVRGVGYKLLDGTDAD